MSDNLINKPNEPSITSLDDVNLGDIHDPSGITPNTPSPTGNVPQNPAPTTATDDDPNKPVAPVAPAADPNKPDEAANNTFTIATFEDLTNLLTSKTSDQLTEEENNELADIVDAFGGTAFNDKGEIVDAENNILFTADQLKHYLETNELPIDDNGDFVDANGNVVKSKVELFRENTTVGTVMNALARNFDVAFADTFMPDDTEDSLVDVVNKVVGVVKQSSVEEYFKANPELEGFRKHLLLNGSAEGYKSSAVDYDKIDVKTLSKEAKSLYVADAYKATGRTLTPAYSKYLEGLDEETFNTEVIENIKVLKDIQTNKQKEVDAQLQAQERQRAQEAKQYWDSVTNTIKSGKISNINIPIPERDAFLAYVTTPVKDGKTKDILDAEKEGVDIDLLTSYLRYKGYDLSVLAKNIATTQQVQSLREKMSKNNRRNISNSGKGHKPTTQNNDYIPNLGEVNL